MTTTTATSTDYAKLVTDELGNIKGLDVPEYNRINEGDTIAVKRAKAEAQRKQFDAQRQAESFARQPDIFKHEAARRSFA